MAATTTVIALDRHRHANLRDGHFMTHLSVSPEGIRFLICGLYEKSPSPFCFLCLYSVDRYLDQRLSLALASSSFLSVIALVNPRQTCWFFARWLPHK